MSGERITITPVTRIEGHARLRIDLDDRGNVADTRLSVVSLRGFEQFLRGRAAEEVPRIVTRICGVCPWMHHLASVMAVDRCFGVSIPQTAHLLRELCLVLAHAGDKILHFFFLAGPDLLDNERKLPGLPGLAQSHPQQACRAADMLRLVHTLLDRFTGRAIHPVAAVCGGFSRPLDRELHAELQNNLRTLLDYALASLEFGSRILLDRFDRLNDDPDTIETGFLGTVAPDGGLTLYGGRLRLMDTRGTCTDFPSQDFRAYIREQTLPWSYGKMAWTPHWGEPFSLDPQQPGGIYRTNTLARLNVCDHIPTPRASQALDEFRSRFGRPAQATFLYHWARLIELVYCCERALDLLDDDRILARDTRVSVQPGRGHGIGHVEAPRGTLIHEYRTDDNGCISQADIIVGTGHNLAAMNLSVKKTATRLIRNGQWDKTILNRISMAVRAYDP